MPRKPEPAALETSQEAFDSLITDLDKWRDVREFFPFRFAPGTIDLFPPNPKGKAAHERAVLDDERREAARLRVLEKIKSVIAMVVRAGKDGSLLTEIWGRVERNHVPQSDEYERLKAGLRNLAFEVAATKSKSSDAIDAKWISPAEASIMVRYHVFVRHEGRDEVAGFLNDSRFENFKSWIGQPQSDHIQRLMYSNELDGEGIWYCLFKMNDPTLELTSHPNDPSWAETYVDKDSYVLVYTQKEAIEWFARNGRELPNFLKLPESKSDTGQSVSRLKINSDGDVAILDGESIRITPSMGRILKILLEAKGDWVSSRKMKADPNSSERPDRLMKKIPPKILALIETTRQGNRIKNNTQ